MVVFSQKIESPTIPGRFSYDILVIDECSTVSNKDMKQILDKVETKLLVLVGDTFQIESIRFGNWFSIIRDFVDDDSVLQLETPYRTNNENLLTVWNRVRELDEAILELIVKHGYSVPLDNSILNTPNDDEIILCLNYDGIYGINNLNKFLQGINQNQPVYWGVNTYKIDDPILFNEVERFSPLIHNNMKGRIVNVEKLYDEIYFSIALDVAINEIEAIGYDFELLPSQENGNSVIKFKVSKHPGSDEDGDYSDAIVPFQIAYAVSIHKAQGLEYKSVKIVITNDVEDMITHNIFYTAITRAREDLKIYWTPETEKSVFDSFTKKNFSKDVKFLKSLKDST
ncbi:ATP-binding domain-containing protein [Psychrobacter phenylpyruvicus]|nr:ATP-dependent RecD-like DNA helicase [Psychrobacter phenylpyruvicus]